MAPLTLLAASFTTFAVTNADDLVLLTLFFARRIPARRVVAGQYLGFSAIIFLSLAGVLAALAIPHEWIRALGLLPLALGIGQLYRVRSRAPSGVQGATSGVVSIALITLTSGADNVGVYVPFFLVNRSALWWILACYSVYVGMWCFVGRWIGNHPAVLRSVDRWGHWLMPVVLIGLGVYILVF
jgi:cadmium resistance protein CadD (predicted permease)